MKKAGMALAIFLLGLIGCKGDKQAQEGLITIDVTGDYPKKEFFLQDFMDVEYIPLASTDSFITKGKLMDVGENILILSNAREGDILIFDRATGQGLKTINHRGQGAEEYLIPINVILDETNGELFANDGPSSKIQVYDIDGNFKRTLPYRKGAFVSNIYNYDKDHLLCQDTYAPENTDSKHSFFLLSKQDGTIENIQIPYEKKISTVIVKKVGDMVYGNAPRNSLITPVQDKWILTEPSTDTIYRNEPNGGLQPFITRTPSVRTMEPEIFLFPGVISPRYYFLQTVKKECDFEKNQDMP
ncbi:MAG: 6-bladed beta-propeller, partial [Parabacteroides sp.]|nr:6-bladed beta-propeller [Parabacteroides sp.]